MPNAEALNHLVVFLTGITPLPLGTACCLFFSLPNPSAPPAWNYLGYLTNEKPSAIYKLSNLAKTVTHENFMNEITSPIFGFSQAPVGLAQVGISVEPLESVVQMVPALETTASNIASFSSFINKTVNNIYNYCASFGRTKGQLMNDMTVGPDTQFVPLSIIQSWFETYSRRLSNDQNFWRSLN